GQDDVLGDVELRLDRVMSAGRRGAKQCERRQAGEQCRLAHSGFSLFIRCNSVSPVVPAKAGTQYSRAIVVVSEQPLPIQCLLGPRFRGDDSKGNVCLFSRYCAFTNNSGSGNTTYGLAQPSLIDSSSTFMPSSSWVIREGQ